MLDKLLASPQLRQEASEKLLEIAKFLSVDELAEQYEQALCQFLSPEVKTRLVCDIGIRRHTRYSIAKFLSVNELDSAIWCCTSFSAPR